MRTVVFALALLLVPCFAGITPAADAPAPAAELRLLEDMIGTWDEVMTVKPVEPWAKAETRASVTKRAWSLGGKLMRSDGAWQSPTTEFLYLISYDAPAGVYRCWYFDSADAMQKDPMAGTWDAKSRTLTWTSTDAADNQTVAKHKIIDKDRHSVPDFRDRPVVAVFLFAPRQLSLLGGGHVPIHSEFDQPLASHNRERVLIADHDVGVREPLLAP